MNNLTTEQKLLERIILCNIHKKKPLVHNVALESILQELPIHVYWKDKNCVLIGTNTNYANYVGFSSAAEMIGLDDADIAEIMGIDQSYAQKIFAVDKEIMHTGIAVTVEEPHYAHGKPKVFLSHKMPLRNKKGEIIGILGISADITERKQIEQELARAKTENEQLAKLSNTYLQNILKHLPEPVFWMDRDSIILGCNDKEASQILGVKNAEDIIGKSMYDLASVLSWNQAIIETLHANNKEIMASGIGKVYEEELVGPDGNKRYYISHKAPLRDETENVIGIIGASVDITERKYLEKELRIAKERAEASSKAKSEFLAVTSHELRTPLSGIMGMLQLLANDDSSLNAQQSEYLKHAMSASQHLLSLVNDVLDFSKIEAGKFDLYPTPIDLKEIVEEIALMLTAQAKNSGLEILTNYAPTVPHLLIADSRALRQVLINLLGNAIKFTEEGFISLTVRSLQQTDGIVHLELSVTDTGIGIAADKLEMIFEHFQQVDSSYTRRRGGTGLGLAITKHLVELMDGSIKVTSELGKGSTFHCYIPFPLQSEAISQAPWELYESKVNVLIVDDTTRGEVLRRQISPTHCKVSSGAAALDNLVSAQQLNQPYQVVIIDQQLTTIDAFQLAADINSRRGLLKPMLLLMSKEQSINHYRKACEIGFYDCLTKPLQPTVLQATLTAAWEKWMEKKGELLHGKSE
ncbi:hypothetical protein BH10PSE19_BH10PSE19_21690 [soil metagenome]